MNTVVSMKQFKKEKSHINPNHVRIKDIHEYRQIVLWLMDEGCNPLSYPRSDGIRFYVNKAGNFWADGVHMFEACELAVNNWIDAGMPEEGNHDDS